MFGHYANKRAQRRLDKQKNQLRTQQSEWDRNAPGREKEAMDYQTKRVSEMASQSAADEKAARNEGINDTEEYFKRDIQGLDPEKKKALQYEANKGIQRNMQSANRKLLGEQSQHGIVGRGGVGYAQQRDLQRLGQEAQGQARRDLTNLDRDLALKNKAAIFAAGEGRAATAGLNKQMALQELQLQEEKKRQREIENEMRKAWSVL